MEKNGCTLSFIMATLEILAELKKTVGRKRSIWR